MEIIEKVAYLKGLAEGLGIDDSTKEGKAIKLIIDLLDDVALTISDMSDGLDILGDHVELIDEDLEDLISEIYDDDDDCGCGCHSFRGELYEVTCPACKDVVYVDEDMLGDGEIDCPGCGESLEFDLDGVPGATADDEDA